MYVACAGLSLFHLVLSSLIHQLVSDVTICLDLLCCAGITSAKQLIPYKELCLLPAARQGPPPPAAAGPQSIGGSAAAAADDASMSEAEQAAAAEAQALSRALGQVVAACEGFSGRSLRKLPFLAHATADSLPCPCSCFHFLAAMKAAAEKERADRSELTSG
jgi:hypothetical protein